MKTAESIAPEEFGPYIVYERLGVGGMATVHRAKKRGIAGFERGVALKRMLPHLAEDAEFINSFVREAKLASLLVHPNIAQIYDFGRVGAVYYIAMEHVDGFDVRKMLRYSNRHKEPLPLNVVMSVLCELCDALEYAHTFVDEHGQPQGIVHRDVSPSNLIVAQSGHLKVIDFGIAKANVRQLHTESGRVKGKLGYMSPEAVTGRAFGPVSDVFSAGVVAHELLTAHPLFSAKTDYDTLIRIHEAEIPPPSRRNPGVPASLDEVVLAALARDPERRLQTAGAFREALEYVAEQSGVRFSARDVAEWRAKIATTEDPWGGRTGLPGGSTGAVSRGFPFPESRNSTSLSGVNQRPLPDQALLRPSQEVRARGATQAELADEDKSVADMTWGADADKSSTQHPIPDQAMVPIAAPALPPRPMIGASIQAQAPRRNSFARIALVVLFGIAAMLAVYQFVLRKKPPVVAPTPPIASIKFIVQPADSVVEIGGKEAGHNSPFDAPLEPGVYSIAVRHAGYKQWTSQVTLRDGEKQTVRVALEAGVARVSVTSLPAGLVAQLDGKPIEQVTPLDIQTTAGTHTLVVTNASGLTWSQEFTAEIDGKYTFHAPLTAVKKPQPAVAPNPPSRPTPPPDRDRTDRTPDRDRTDRTPDRTPKRPTPPTPSVTDEPRITEPKVETPAIPKDAGVPPLVAPKPADPKPVLPKPVGTAMVPVTAVTKLSGSIPALKVSSSEEAADVLAKICIDETGHVTSVKIMKGLPEITEELHAAFMGWRYKPYSNAAGTVSGACFALQMHVVFKHAN